MWVRNHVRQSINDKDKREIDARCGAREVESMYLPLIGANVVALLLVAAMEGVRRGCSFQWGKEERSYSLRTSARLEPRGSWSSHLSQRRASFIASRPRESSPFFHSSSAPCPKALMSLNSAIMLFACSM